jgi:hypothetical protein
LTVNASTNRFLPVMRRTRLLWVVFFFLTCGGFAESGADAWLRSARFPGAGESSGANAAAD